MNLSELGKALVCVGVVMILVGVVCDQRAKDERLKQPIPVRLPLPQPPGETTEPPLAVTMTLGTNDTVAERVDDNAPPKPLRDWIEKRIEDRVNSRVETAFVEAAGDEKRGLGSIIAACILTIVKRLVATLIVAAVVSVLWTYWGVAAALLVVVALVGYVAGSIGGRRAAKG